MSNRTHAVTVNLTIEEVGALHYWRTVDSSPDMVLDNTNVDLNDLILKLAQAIPGDRLGNQNHQEGCDRCANCGCKYWEFDQCIDCGGKEIQK